MEFRFNAQGLLPAIVQDQRGQVLMLAYMNEDSLKKTLETGETWFYSRSRQELWHKGATSGNVQRIKDITTDCDQDTLLITVEQLGNGACHEGDYSCFHHSVKTFASADPGPRVLDDVHSVVAHRKLHPKEGSYTNYLLDTGLDKILKKVGEETAEVIIAAKNGDGKEISYEVGDLLYHLLVLMVHQDVEPQQVWKELDSRR